MAWQGAVASTLGIGQLDAACAAIVHLAQATRNPSGYGRRGPALGGTVYRASTFLRFKSLPYALTLSKTALPTALTQELPRCTLKVPAQAHWPRWQRSRCSSGMLLTAVDDGVVDLGRFSCVSYLAAWQQPIKPGVQQLSAALWRGRS